MEQFMCENGQEDQEEHRVVTFHSDIECELIKNSS